MRLVVILDRVGDSGVLALVQRVIAAHRALQFREFIDHFGDEIGLGQARRLLGEVRIGAHHRRQLAHQRRHTLHLVSHRAQLFVEGDLAQPFGHLAQRRLPVIVPEMSRVGETRREHARIARSNRLAAIGGHLVGHADEFRRHARLARLFHGEVFLVRLHRQGDDFRRQVQEVRVHLAQQRHRPFHQSGDLGQKPRILDQFQTGVAAHLARALQDDRLALGARLDDMALFAQHLGVLRIIGDRERPAAHAAMAFGDIAGADPEHLEIHHLTVKQAQKALQRTHPALGHLPLAELHRFGPGEGLHHLRDRLGDHIRRSAARLFDDGDPERSLLVLALFALVQRGHTGAAQEALDGLLRRIHARPLALFAHILGLHRQAVDHQAQTARSGKGRQRGPGQSGRLQLLAQQFFQVRLGARLHPGRDFLAEDFKQQFRHCEFRYEVNSWAVQRSISA